MCECVLPRCDKVTLAATAGEAALAHTHLLTSFILPAVATIRVNPDSTWTFPHCSTLLYPYPFPSHFIHLHLHCTPDFSQKFLVQVDASTTGIGAVLAQGNAGEERPVVYLTRKLLPRETRYLAVEKEGLAIKWSLDCLCYYLLGQEFNLETDHRALTWIQSMKDHNARVT